MGITADEAFAAIVRKEFDLDERYDLLFADWLRIMREQNPAICGMAFHAKGSNAREGYTCHYWDKRVYDELAGWCQIYQRNPEYKDAVFYLWRDGEMSKFFHPAHFFGELHFWLKNE